MAHERWHSCLLQGVLRVHFIEAQDLQGKDTYLKGLVKGKSDPYGVIRVGNQIFQSKVIKENLSPKWNEVYEVRPASAPRLRPEPRFCSCHPGCRSFRWRCKFPLLPFSSLRSVAPPPPPHHILAMPTLNILDLNRTITVSKWQISSSCECFMLLLTHMQK